MKTEHKIIMGVQLVTTVILIVVIFYLKPIEIKSTSISASDAKLNQLSTQIGQLQAEVAQLRMRIETTSLVK